jgi:ribosomal protein S18 acetylase RimI-like enzyme
MNDRNTRVRTATGEDASRIGQIHVEGWCAAYRGIIPDAVLDGLSAEQRAAGWRHALAKDPACVLVSEKSGVVTGWVALGKSRDGLDSTGEVFALYVDPAAWRQGYGSRLMDAAESELWARGYASIVRRRGFAQDGGEKVERFTDMELLEVRMALANPKHQPKA